MVTETKNELLIAFGLKLLALRRGSGLSQTQVASPEAADFSVKTISAKERGVGSRAPAEAFVALYVQRCRDHAQRRGSLPDSDYDLRAWERARTLLEDALFEQAALGREGLVDLAEDPQEPEAEVLLTGSQDERIVTVDRVPSTQFRRLADWTPRTFGVQAPVASQHPAPAQDVGPVYLPRTFDRALRADLLHGHEVAPRCIALSGWSSVGKTRSAWAAATAVLPADTLLARPEDAGELLDLLAGPVPAGSVVFLDDAARHFKEPELHEVVRRLQPLLKRRKPVVVLLTVHPLTLGQYEELTDDPERDGRAKRALSLIDVIHQVDEQLPDLTDARHAAKVDPQLRDALEAAADTGRIIPMITGGPQLVSRLTRLAPETRALILGATDCRRLGHTAPLTNALLADAAFAHLDRHERARTGDTWLSNALDAAGRRVTGQIAALYPVNDSSVYQVEGFDVSPYLVNHRERQQAPIPTHVWQALHDNVADGDQLMLLGHAAHSRAVYSWAYRYFTRARLMQHQHAGRALGRLLDEVHWTRPAPAPIETLTITQSQSHSADRDDIDVVLDEIEEVLLHSEMEMDPLAEHIMPLSRPPSIGLYAKAAVEELQDRPDVRAKLDIGDDWYAWYAELWRDLEGHYRDRSPGRTSLLNQVLRAYSTEDIKMGLGLVWCMENQVDANEPSNVEERRQLLERALAAGTRVDEVCGRLQEMAVQAQDWEELSRVSELGGVTALQEEAWILVRAGMLDRAEQRYEQLAERFGAHTGLMGFWWRTGRQVQAEAALRQHIVAGNRLSLLQLINWVRDAGRVAEADSLRRSGLEPDGSTSAWTPPPRA